MRGFARRASAACHPGAMSEKKTTKKPAKAKTAPKKSAGAKKASSGGGPSFPEELAKLLRRRKLKVPAGLAEAPAVAYASQPASVVEQLDKLDDAALQAQADHIAGYAARQAERAKKAWDTSPLIAEIRRRKLTEPPRPTRVVGAAFSLKKPLGEWSDRELLDVAGEWSERGRS